MNSFNKNSVQVFIFCFEESIFIFYCNYMKILINNYHDLKSKFQLKKMLFQFYHNYMKKKLKNN
jgi:hypothetical protein